MTVDERIRELEEQVEKKSAELRKFNQSWPKIIALLIMMIFVLPFIPLRNGTLESQYGYWGAVLFSTCVVVLFVPLAASYAVDKMKTELRSLERNLELEKRRKDL